MGLMRGNVIVSLILVVLVRRAVSLSSPHPQPAVGGRPYSRAVQNPSSGSILSGSDIPLLQQIRIRIINRQTII